MRFRIIPSTSDGRRQLLTSYLLNDSLAIDAGAIAIGLTKEEQLRIKSIVITHAHLDHTVSLPLFLTDLLDEIRDPVNVYATASDYDAILQNLFNSRVWVPIETLQNDHTRLINPQRVESGESFYAEGFKITPIPVSHTVLTHGLLVEDRASAILFTSDTSATDRIWEKTYAMTHLKAVFIDLSFPSRLTHIARASGHHSPATLLEELPKINPNAGVYAVHLKAAYREEIEAELNGFQNSRINIAEIGREYEF